jgi:PAS domain S-box-containing protein
MMSYRILVIDDEESIRFTFEAFLREAGYHVETADSLEAAMPLIEQADYDAVFLDILLGRDSGMKVLKLSREYNPNGSVVMVTGAPDVNTASEAVRLGAFDYITKPVHQEDLLRLAKLATEHKSLLDRHETDRLRMAAVFQSVQEGILVFDGQRRLVDINTSACKMLGCSSDLVGRALDDLASLAGCRAIAALQELVEYRCEGEIFRLETVEGAGAPLILSLTMAPLTSSSGQENGVVLVLRDETRPMRQVEFTEETYRSKDV